MHEEAIHFTHILESIRPFCFDICMEVRSGPFQAKIRQRDFTRLYELTNARHFVPAHAQFHQQFNVSGEDCMGLFASQGFYHHNIRKYYRKPKRGRTYLYGHFPATVMFKECKRGPNMSQEEFERMCCNKFY